METIGGVFMYTWTTAQVKESAKNALRSFGYWRAFLVTLIVAFATGGSAGGSSAASGSSAESGGYIGSLDPAVLTAVVSAAIIIFAVSLAFSIFISAPLFVGQSRYFMEHRGSNPSVGRIFYAFSGNNYLNVVKIMFFMNLKIFLWSLLFIIPGIIKSFEYFAIPYILAENPGIDSKRAFEISKQMTMGEKLNIFWLGITFIGWHLLAMLACGIGEFFLMPYIQATDAEVYSILRDKAHETGISDFAELPGFFAD